MKEKLKKIPIIDLIICIILSTLQFYSVHTFFAEMIKSYTLFFTPIIFIITYYMIRVIKNELKSSNKIKYLFQLVLVFIFGTILIKSFIINIYPIAIMEMQKAIIYGVGWSLFGMSILLNLKVLLRKISFKGKMFEEKGLKSFLLYCIPSVVILGAVFVLYYPGIGSIDTLVIWSNIQNSHYSDAHPIMLMMLYKGLSLIWNNIAVVTLFQVIICILSFGYTAYYFFCKGLKKIWCFAIAVILPLLPTNTIYSILLWKDIPYTIGLLVFTIFIMKIIEDDYLYKYKNIVKLVVVGIFVMFMRHNGFIPIIGGIGLLGLYFLIKKHYKYVFKLIIVGVFLVAGYYGLKNITLNLINKDTSPGKTSATYDGNSLMTLSIPTTVFTHQIIYIQDEAGDEFTTEQREKFDEFFYADMVENHKFKYRQGDKYGPNWQFYHKPYETVKVIPNGMDLVRYYFGLFKEHPIMALDSYQKLIGIIWSSSDYGPIAYRGYFVNGLRGYVSQEYRNYMSPVTDFLDKYIYDVYKGALIIFVKPAFYLLIILLMCYVSYKRHKWKLILIMSPVFLNMIGYFVAIASQDVRYFYINFLAFIIAIFYAFMKNEDEKSEFAHKTL